MNESFSVSSVQPSNVPLRLAVLAMLAMPPAGAMAQIFECIDAGGNREFTQKCAPGTVRQREVSKGGASNLSEGASPPQTSYKDEEFAFRQRQLEREANETKAKAAAEDAAKKCLNARSRLTSLENARRVSAGIDPQSGQTKYLDDNERAAATEKARDAVAAYCK
jgi:hypothetical protein